MSWHHLGLNCSHMLILQRSPWYLDLKDGQSQEGWGEKLSKRYRERDIESGGEASSSLIPTRVWEGMERHGILRIMILGLRSRIRDHTGLEYVETLQKLKAISWSKMAMGSWHPVLPSWAHPDKNTKLELGPPASSKSHKLLLHLFLFSFIYSLISLSIWSINSDVESLGFELEKHQMNLATLVILYWSKVLIDFWVIKPLIFRHMWMISSQYPI